MILPEVRRYLLDDAVMPLAWAETVLNDNAESFAAHGWGLWGVRRVKTNELVGTVGFREFFEPPELQLLYALHPHQWGQGFATEAAEAVIRYGIDRLGMARVLACADAPNTASLAVMRRIGLRFLKRVARGGKESIYYGVEAADWRYGEDASEWSANGWSCGTM